MSERENAKTLASDFRIVRSLGHSEDVTADFTRSNSFIIVYNLAISTTKPVLDETFRKCLSDWKNVFPMLRMRLSIIDGVKYFQEMTTFDIDYQRQRVDGRWLEVYNTMLDTPYEDQGPLWRVKVLQLDSENSDPAKYRYMLLVSWSHVITDGTSNIHMCNRLMEILDASIGGEEPNTDSDIVVSPPIEEMLPKKDYLWSEVLPILKEDLSISQGTTVWSKVFPGLEDKEVRTKLVDLGGLDEETTKAMVQRCKQEGATVHGALITAIHLALFKAYTKNPWIQNNITDDKLTIMSAHAVSARRCYTTPDNVYGYHINGFALPFSVSKEAQPGFWQSAKEATFRLRNALSVDDLAMKIMTTDTLHDGASQIEEMKKNPNCIFDYGASNMRDIKSMFPGVYKNLEVTWLSRSTSIQYYGFPFTVNATTFRGKFLVTMDYVTNLASEKQVRFIGEEFMSILRANISY